MQTLFLSPRNISHEIRAKSLSQAEPPEDLLQNTFNLSYLSALVDTKCPSNGYLFV
jgi:hypothetical protein